VADTWYVVPHREKYVKSNRIGLFVAILAATASAVNCTRTPTSPTVPAVPARTALAPFLSFQVTPAIDAMRIGETLSFSIAIELGEGVPPSGPMPMWSSSNPAVIAIDPGGRATAVAQGESTIQVAAHGHRTSRQIRVRP
jgi:hypothetical protein